MGQPAEEAWLGGDMGEGGDGFAGCQPLSLTCPSCSEVVAIDEAVVSVE